MSVTVGIAVEITVRVATEADIDAAFAVFESVVDEGAWLGTEPGFDREERRKWFLAGVADERRAMLVAVAGAGHGVGGGSGEVVGLAFVEVAPYNVAGFGMCVAQSWRRQGAGGALVEAAVEAARGIGAHKVSIEVWPHNDAAIRLYERHGFVVEGRKRRHYRRRNGELWDAVMMGLVLEEEDNPR